MLFIDVFISVCPVRQLFISVYVCTLRTFCFFQGEGRGGSCYWSGLPSPMFSWMYYTGISAAFGTSTVESSHNKAQIPLHPPPSTDWAAPPHMTHCRHWSSTSWLLHSYLACYGCKVTPHWIIGRWGWSSVCAWVATSIGGISSLRWWASHWPTHVPGHGSSHMTSHRTSWHSLGWHSLMRHAWHGTPILRGSRAERRAGLVCVQLLHCQNYNNGVISLVKNRISLNLSTFSNRSTSSVSSYQLPSIGDNCWESLAIATWAFFLFF